VASIQFYYAENPKSLPTDSLNIKRVFSISVRLLAETVLPLDEC
jgi:hypothetical protein